MTSIWVLVSEQQAVCLQSHPPVLESLLLYSLFNVDLCMGKYSVSGPVMLVISVPECRRHLCQLHICPVTVDMEGGHNGGHLKRINYLRLDHDIHIPALKD